MIMEKKDSKWRTKEFILPTLEQSNKLEYKYVIVNGDKQQEENGPNREVNLSSFFKQDDNTVLLVEDYEFDTRVVNYPKFTKK